jgi:hypothetical protein
VPSRILPSRPAQTGSVDRFRGSSDRRAVLAGRRAAPADRWAIPAGRSGVPAGRRPVVDEGPTLDHLDERMINFIRHQEMVFITASVLRPGDPPARTSRRGPRGFVHVASRRMVAWPEFGPPPGPAFDGQISLFMLDLFRDVAGLHVLGRASVAAFAPPQLCDAPAAPPLAGRPTAWVRMHVEAAWFDAA